MKKILIVLSLLLITGCAPKYKLNIQGDSIKETIYIPVDQEYIEDLQYFKSIYTNNLANLYKYSFNSETKILNYTYKYTFDNYINSASLQSCFTTYNVINNTEYLQISTGGTFKCLPYQYDDYRSYDYDSLDIEITTNHKVISNNADKVDNGTYHWYINKDNISTKTINFKISKDELIIKPYFGLEFVIFVSAISIICVIIGIVILSKNKKNNKI